MHSQSSETAAAAVFPMSSPNESMICEILLHSALLSSNGDVNGFESASFCPLLLASGSTSSMTTSLLLLLFALTSEEEEMTEADSEARLSVETGTLY